jgi:hypothetical protein
MKPFDLEAFKQGAVAVDEYGIYWKMDRQVNDVLFEVVPADLSQKVSWAATRSYRDLGTLCGWYMKQEKWIVFREFDSEEAAELFAHMSNSFDRRWKIEKR